MARERYPCPHCGELIDEAATFCRHCGSDEETGWKPDTDYYSVELPEDDEKEEEEEKLRRGPSVDLKERLRSLAGPALVVAALALFVIYGFTQYRPSLLVLIPAVYLALVVLLLIRLSGRPDTPAD